MIDTKISKVVVSPEEEKSQSHRKNKVEYQALGNNLVTDND